MQTRTNVFAYNRMKRLLIGAAKGWCVPRNRVVSVVNGSTVPCGKAGGGLVETYRVVWPKAETLLDLIQGRSGLEFWQ